MLLSSVSSSSQNSSCPIHSWPNRSETHFPLSAAHFLLPVFLSGLIAHRKWMCLSHIHPSSPPISSPVAPASSAPLLLPTSGLSPPSSHLLISHLSLPSPHPISSIFPPSFILLSHSSDLLVLFFRLVLPSERWWFNLSLSSACRWAADGCCWSCSRRSIWGCQQPNSPRRCSLFLTSCLLLRLFLASQVETRWKHARTFRLTGCLKREV